MPTDEHPGSVELIDLAEASLALGDADAALQLLDQVEDGDRDNRWIAAQVEALRCRGDSDNCRMLATASLGSMIDDCDWFNARRVLIETGRAFDDQRLERECIEFFHQIWVKVRPIVGLDPLFLTQLISVLASRVHSQGDVKTASTLIWGIETEILQISDRRALASALWVKAEIAESLADIDSSFSLMEKAYALFQEENDALAMHRIVMGMAGLLIGFADVNPELLSRALDYVKISASKQLGEGTEDSRLLFVLYEAHLELSLGNAALAIEILEGIEQDHDIRDEMLCWTNLILALSEKRLERDVRSSWHLENAIQLADQLGSGFQHLWYLRQIGYACFDLGRIDQGQAFWARGATPIEDYSWCLPCDENPSC
jgi:tetratricopeptide (TPR) repeat protein